MSTRLSPSRRSALETVARGIVTLSWPIGPGRARWYVNSVPVERPAPYRWLEDARLIAFRSSGFKQSDVYLTEAGKHALQLKEER